ncbi:MAG TPA: GAF domain-containing protein [Candidatus Sulfotelmatobacter sp.]|nr:GAF domain-containing protein [Candidatus Sulfotelmatobacter sp.]
MSKTPEAVKDATAAFLDWMNGHVPFFAWIMLVLLVVIVVLVARALLVKIRIDEKNRKDAEDAIAGQRAAENVAEIANAENDRLRLILKMIDRSLRRQDDIEHEEGNAVLPDGVRYLTEWIVRGLTFEKPDINKLVVFQPSREDPNVLTVIEQSGMSPESGRAIRWPVRPETDDRDSFAAKAFRNNRIERCDDTQLDPRYVHIDGHAPTQSYRSIVAVPIRHGSRVIGVYTIDSREAARFSAGQPIIEQLDLYGRLFALFMVPTVGDVSIMNSNEARAVPQSGPTGSPPAPKDETHEPPPGEALRTN